MYDKFGLFKGQRVDPREIDIVSSWFGSLFK